MSVDSIFKQIDGLYGQSMEQILSLAAPRDATPQSYEEMRTERVKKTLAFLQQMGRLLEVAQLHISQLSPAELSEHLWSDQLDVYRSKYEHLREVLKRKQLENYARESEFIHQQRLQQYDVGGGDEDGEGEGDEEGDQDGEQKKDNASIVGPKPKASVDDQILQQNKDISQSLRSTKQLMAMTIMQTELNIDNIDQQSQDLRKLNDKLVDLDQLLGKSKQIVRFIEKQDKGDKRRIYLSLCFLVLCSMYVLYRRVLKVPLRIVLWSGLKAFGLLHWASSALRPMSEPGSASYTFKAPSVTSVKPSKSPLLSAPASVPSSSGPSHSSSAPSHSSSLSSVPSSSVPSINVSSLPVSASSSLPSTPGASSVLVDIGLDTPYVQDVDLDRAVMTWPDLRDVKSEEGLEDPKESGLKESDPKDSDPKEADPEESDPKDSDPKDSDPKDSDPKDSDPKDSDPKDSDPKDSDPKDSDPKESDPKKSDPIESDCPSDFPTAGQYNVGKDSIAHPSQDESGHASAGAKQAAVDAELHDTARENNIYEAVQTVMKEQPVKVVDGGAHKVLENVQEKEQVDEIRLGENRGPAESAEDFSEGTSGREALEPMDVHGHDEL